MFAIRTGAATRREAGFFLCFLLLAVAACFAGCAPVVTQPYKNQPHLPKKPDQETAELLIQQRLSELTGWQAPPTWRMPEVEWVEGAALTCYGEGWYVYWARTATNTCSTGTPVDTAPVEGPGLTGGGPACRVCLLGISLFRENVIQSNWVEGRKIHQSSLVHEYCHYFELWATGSGDGGHTGPCYTGPRWVDTVNRDLESAGF